MSNVFRIKEIVDFAIEREKEAAALYEKLSNEVTDEKLKQLFKTLASQEIFHEKFYSELSSHIEEERSPGPKSEEEYAGYMDNLIEAARTAKMPEDFSNVSAVLDYAIAREKDSVLFYSGLRNFVKPHVHKDIDHIIREEQKHATILTNIKRDLDIVS